MATSNNRSILFIILGLAGLGVILLFAPTLLDRINQEKTMTSTPDNVAAPVETPQLDAEMPATTRTATFAMG
jgi:hypothetical protein